MRFSVDRFLYDNVAAVAADCDVPRNLVLAVILQESGGDPEAVGDGEHSVGLMQLHDRGAGAGMTVEERRNAFRNIAAGVLYLASCYTRTRSWPLACTVYNCGYAGWEAAGKPAETVYSRSVLALWRRIDASEVVTICPAMGWLSEPGAGR